MLPVGEADMPVFGAEGEIYYRAADGAQNFLYAVREDGTGRRRLREEPIHELVNGSPDGRWILAWSRLPGRQAPGEELSNGVVAYPIPKGPPTLACGRCRIEWSPDGRLLYIAALADPGGMVSPHIYVLPVSPDRPFAALPPGGFDLAGLSKVRGAHRIGGENVIPGPDPSTYAFRRFSVHRNLYRVPLP
jgi:hypothetical protein